jgi:hypothetical protein
MSENSTDALLNELKNLNNDLKNELKKEEIVNSTLNTSVSTTSVSNSSQNMPQTPLIILTDDNLNEFILQNAQRIVIEGVKTIKDLQTIVSSTFDSKLLVGYAEVVKATTSSIDTLNKLNIEKQKFKANKEIKQMDIDAKSKLPKEKGTVNNLNIIATREQVIKMMENMDKKEAIDVPSKEILPDR